MGIEAFHESPVWGRPGTVAHPGPCLESRTAHAPTRKLSQARSVGQPLAPPGLKPNVARGLAARPRRLHPAEPSGSAALVVCCKKVWIRASTTHGWNLFHPPPRVGVPGNPATRQRTLGQSSWRQRKSRAVPLFQGHERLVVDLLFRPFRLLADGFLRDIIPGPVQVLVFFEFHMATNGLKGLLMVGRDEGLSYAKCKIFRTCGK